MVPTVLTFVEIVAMAESVTPSQASVKALSHVKMDMLARNVIEVIIFLCCWCI